MQSNQINLCSQHNGSSVVIAHNVLAHQAQNISILALFTLNQKFAQYQ